MVLAWAIVMNPDHPHLHSWHRTLQIWAINIASCNTDKTDHSPHPARSVSYCVNTQTLFPDMTAENHGFFNPELLSYSSWVVLCMAAFHLYGKETPSFFRQKHHQETFDILLRFCLPNGMYYSPGGYDMPMFVPHPFGLAWGLWNNDPRAMRLTEKLLSWIDSRLRSDEEDSGQWVLGFTPAYEGWELFFQSQVGFELALLSALPFPTEVRFYSSGQIASAVDTQHIYPYVEVCYRRNIRTSRSIAWKALGNHPLIGISIHALPELVAPYKAALLGIPSISNRPIRSFQTVFHTDNFQKDGFDTYGRTYYYGTSKEKILRRDIRAITWGEEGIVVLDEIRAEMDIELDEQYLSPIHLVNDHWTGNRLNFSSGSLKETFTANQQKYRGVSCPSFWASVENHLLFQFLWGRDKGLVYVPGGERNAPPYWNNCRLDMLAVHIDTGEFAREESVYRVGFFIGSGKGPRPFKSAGTPGEFFNGMVIMDGKNTLGLS
jgi:hypothetical protein